MSDPEPAPSPEKPAQLNYATPQGAEHGHPAFAVAGFFVAAMFWLVVVAVVSLGTTNALSNTVGSRGSPVAMALVVFVIASIAILLITIGGMRRKRQFFLLGLLIGTATTGLLQGICFLNM